MGKANIVVNSPFLVALKSLVMVNGSEIEISAEDENTERQPWQGGGRDECVFVCADDCRGTMPAPSSHPDSTIFGCVHAQ